MKYTLAVIDDETDILDNLVHLLESEGGYEVRAFTSAREAYEVLSKDAPDAVLTDISMPEMSGLELIAGLRENVPDLPVVILSAFVDFKHAVKALRLGATDILEKPYNEEELLDTMAIAASLGKTRKKIFDLIRQSQDESSSEIVNSLKKSQAIMSARSLGDSKD